MRTIRRSIILLSALIAASPAHALVIEFQPTSTSVATGETFGLDLRITGLAEAGETVSAFDLFFGYDPTIVSPLSVAFGSGADAVLGADTSLVFGNTFDLGFAFLGATGLSSADPFSISALMLPAPLPGTLSDTVRLATVTFSALASGNTALTLTGQPNVSGSNPFSVLSFERIGTTAITVEAPVSVPEPEMLLLLGSGLLLSWAMKRDRR